MTKEEFQKKLLNSNSSFKFLAADRGYWLNGDDKTILIKNMTKDYKENCVKYLKKQREAIEHGFFLEGVQYDKSEYEEMMRYGIKAMNEKISELSR